MRRDLLDGWVQRVSVADLAGRQLAHLSVRAEGETIPVVLVSGLGLGAIDKASNARLRASSRPQASGLQARCRARIQGGRVVWASATAIAIVRDARTWLFESAAAGPLTLTELEDTSRIVGPSPIDREALDARGADMVSRLAQGGHVDKRLGLLRALAKASSRVARRVEAIRGDLARIGDADGLARRAQLFVAAAGHAPRGATRLAAVDWSSGEPRTVELSLDPSRDARSQIEALFTRSRRLKEGAAIARHRLAEAETSLRALGDVATALETGDGDVEPLIARARAAAPRDFRTQPVAAPGKRAPKRPVALPYRTFVGASGARILVGRGAAHNDALTLTVARPHDLWLHAKGWAGAHVVVPLKKGTSCPTDVLVEAAHLAAHFSDARGEAVVDVQYVERRYVRKPRGSPAGLVVVDRERVLALRQVQGVLKDLLEREAPAEN